MLRCTPPKKNMRDPRYPISQHQCRSAGIKTVICFEIWAPVMEGMMNAYQLASHNPAHIVEMVGFSGTHCIGQSTPEIGLKEIENSAG